MQERAPAGRVVRFGSFELDRDEGRLTKSGLRIRLQGQPFQILTLLLDRPGQIVTREEIRNKLWSQETFVEFNDALNTAISKLRVALSDTADNPRFLETIPRRGYRFIAPVTLPQEPSNGIGGSESAHAPKPQVVAVENFVAPTQRRAAKKLAWRTYTASLVGLLVVAVVIGGYWRFRHPVFRVTNKDTIVLADFVNTTGEAVFDDALRQGLEIGLAQSPAITILPYRKASLILKQMARSPEERMTGMTAIEICQRAGGKVTVQGSISSLERRTSSTSPPFAATHVSPSQMNKCRPAVKRMW